MAENERDEALKRIAEGEDAYVGSIVLGEVLGFLQAAGCGEPGRPNTLWAMTQEIIARATAAEEQAKALKADLAAAAGELLVPIPMPGTDMARLLLANVLLRRERDELRKENARLKEAILLLGCDCDNTGTAECVAALQERWRRLAAAANGNAPQGMAGRCEPCRAARWNQCTRVAPCLNAPQKSDAAKVDAMKRDDGAVHTCAYRTANSGGMRPCGNRATYYEPAGNYGPWLCRAHARLVARRTAPASDSAAICQPEKKP